MATKTIKVHYGISNMASALCPSNGMLNLYLGHVDDCAFFNTTIDIVVEEEKRELTESVLREILSRNNTIGEALNEIFNKGE